MEKGVEKKAVTEEGISVKDWQMDVEDFNNNGCLINGD